MDKLIKTIAIIEDNEIDQMIAQRMITMIMPAVDFKFYPRADEALQLIQSGKFEASVILLDLDLPVFNGFEFLTEIKKIHFDIPIYMLSALPEKLVFEDIQKNILVKGLFSKPLKSDDILRLAKENNLF
jgi:CheY-like chemotaxis protein